MKKLIYLDNGATTKTDEKVVEAMQFFFTQDYGNASSLHKFGQKAKEALEEAREKIAKFINAKPDEIIITSGGTEADNLAIKGAAYANKKNKEGLTKNHIITSKIEHHAVHNSCKALEEEGFEVTYVDVDEDGIIKLDDLKEAIEKNKEKTILVSIMHANNEIGTIQPIEEIAKICKKHNILFHTDAVQSLGKLKIDVKNTNIDMLSASSHKLYGPKGVGFLYVKKGTKLRPLLHGGAHEYGKRAGTENVSGLVGFAKTLELFGLNEKETKKETKLRDKLIKEVLKKIPDSRLNGHPKLRLPGNAHFSFKHIEGESILLYLNDKGIAVSTGSACSSHELKSSHVLLAIGQKEEEAHGSIRITLGKDTTEEDIDYTIQALVDTIAELRKMSPLGK